MIEVKNDFTGGLNLDDSPHKLPHNSYQDALNVTRNAVADSSDNVITNIVGNQLVSYSFHSGGIPTNIGSYPSQLRNSIIEFIFHPTGYHCILEYNNTTRTRSKILENLTDTNNVDILGFLVNEKITSIDVYPRENEGDLLFFIDSLKRPTELDIDKFKAGIYTPVSRELIDVAKMPPAIPPQAVYTNDTTHNGNRLTNRLFRFKYRYIYDDLTKSSFSPISQVPLPVSILSPAYTNVLTNNNLINLTLQCGGINVKSVELGMSFVKGTNKWSDFQSVEVISKDYLGLIQSTSFADLGTGNEQATSIFSNTPTIGTVINIYLNLLPATEILVATYTILLNDDLAAVITGIVASMTSIGIATVSSSTTSQIVWTYNSVTYAFSRIQIVIGANVPDTQIAYAFYNDSTYPNIDISESIQLYDYVPDKALAQGMANGNTIEYGGITEGYDKNTVEDSIITVNTVAAGNGGSVGSLSVIIGAIDFVLDVAFCPVTFSGIPATGTVINLKIRRRSDGVVITGGTYTTVSGDTINSITSNFSVTASNAFVSSHSGGRITIGLGRSTYQALPSSFDWVSMEIVPPSTSLSVNSIATWKWLSQRNIARAYFDQHGKTNGILYTDKVVFPAYAENGSFIPLIPYINYKINDVPPDWAYSMNFYFTKDATNWIFWESLAVQKETAYIYFEVTNFTTNATKNPTTASVCSYAFQDGDRLRLIRRNTDNTVFQSTYDNAIAGLVVEPTINGIVQTGKQFVKINNVEPFTSGMGTADSYVIELYRPAQQASNSDNLVYFELGREYPIIDPTLDTRRHGGEVTDQVVGVTPAEFNFYQGDAYFRARTIANTDTGYATFDVMDKNFVDFYISAVSSIDGRANIIDHNAKRQFFGATIRFSQAYQANTNINGLNRFYSNNLMDVDYSFGNIVRFKVRDRFLKCFQQYKIGSIPLYSQITKDPSGNSVLIVSDKLLNPIQYRVGNFGLSSPESLASWHFADYGCDTSRGVIWRDSNDGLIPISILYKVDSWAVYELPLRVGDIKLYGGIDPKINEYILSLESYDANKCVNVSIASFFLPDGNEGVAYIKSFTLLGTQVFIVSNEIKPSWMTIAVNGNVLTLSGTPTGSGNTTISFNVSNGCGTISLNDTITITASTCTAVLLAGTPVLPNGYIGVVYNYSFDLLGTAPFTLGATTIPSWMTVTIVGSTVFLSGTPDASGTGITVDITIDNCSTDSVTFNGTLDISAASLKNVLLINDTSSYIAVQFDSGSQALGPSASGTIGLLPGGYLENISGSTYMFTFLTALPSTLDPDETPNSDTLVNNGIHTLNASLTNLNYIEVHYP
jgi:hypothetical protein